MKKNILIILSFLIISPSVQAVWSVNGNLTYMPPDPNGNSNGNAYYACPTYDPQKCMSGEGNNITLWGRDGDGNEVIYKTGRIIQINNPSTGKNVEISDIESYLAEIADLVFEIDLD